MPRPHAKTAGRKSNECAMMTFNPYFDSPLRADKWIPRDVSKINVNDEQELAYWCNELRIPIGDLIWLVEKYGTSAERIRALVR
jgi:Protein of unknown function (DUF3606)